MVIKIVKKSTKNVLIGMRIPRDYFHTQGRGESDITIHAGSYHLALKAADIEMCNIMTYSSIMPGIAKQIQKPKLTHGAVMETIMAVAHGTKGQEISAGIIYGWLYNKKTGEKYGGLVCEHNGDYDEKELERRLRASLNELYVNGFSEMYNIKNITTLKESFKVRKRHGTALVAICFINYEVPLL